MHQSGFNGMSVFVAYSIFLWLGMLQVDEILPQGSPCLLQFNGLFGCSTFQSFLSFYMEIFQD